MMEPVSSVSSYSRPQVRGDNSGGPDFRKKWGDDIKIFDFSKQMSPGLDGVSLSVIG